MAEIDAEAVAQRSDAWRESYLPSTPQEEWLYSQVIVSSVRIDGCQRQESELRGHLAFRATVCWDDDRRLDAESVALALARKPALISRKLRQTLQGCDWLLDRWRSLGRVIE